MIRLELLCCPRCRGDLAGDRTLARCVACAAEYPIVEGIPILLRDPALSSVAHEGDLPPRPIYSPWKERLILKALTDAQVALDFGAGRQVFDDPCIIKLDIVFDRTLDVVGDLHELPIKSESLDFVFGGAVMEHIRDPAAAIAELYRVLRPGGYVYADWSFLAAYHGYPHHYSNVTIHGIQQAFKAFTCLEAGVGPHLGPSFALRSVLGTYQEHFAPVTRLEKEFARLVDRLLWHPLDELDARIPAPDRFRIAAGVYFFGVKQPAGHESVLPSPVLRAVRERPELQARYPEPLQVARPDNVMVWARGEGRQHVPAIDEFFRSVTPFSKRDAPAAPRVVHEWPDELMTGVGHDPYLEEVRSVALWFSRSFHARLLDSWDEAGVYGVAHCFYKSLLRIWQRGINGLRRMRARGQR